MRRTHVTIAYRVPGVFTFLCVRVFVLGKKFQQSGVWIDGSGAAFGFQKLGFGGINVGEDGVAVAPQALQIQGVGLKALGGGFTFTAGVHHAINAQTVGFLKGFKAVKHCPVGKLAQAPVGRMVKALVL